MKTSLDHKQPAPDIEVGELHYDSYRNAIVLLTEQVGDNHYAGVIVHNYKDVEAHTYSVGTYLEKISKSRLTRAFVNVTLDSRIEL